MRQVDHEPGVGGVVEAGLPEPVDQVAPVRVDYALGADIGRVGAPFQKQFENVECPDRQRLSRLPRSSLPSAGVWSTIAAVLPSSETGHRTSPSARTLASSCRGASDGGHRHREEWQDSGGAAEARLTRGREGTSLEEAANLHDDPCNRLKIALW